MKAFLSLKDIKQRNNYLRTHLAKRCTQSIQVNHSRKWQPPLVFLPGKVHRHRSLPGYSPWGPKELEAIERTGRHTHCIRHMDFRDTVQRWGAETLSVPRGGEIALHSSLFRVHDASVTESSKRNSESSLCFSPSLIKVEILFSFLSVHKSRY